MERAENKLIDLMKEEMQVRIYGDGPGDPYQWIPKMQNDLKVIYRQVADNYIESGVGLPYHEGTWQMVRAMIVEAGAGSAVGNPAIRTHPGEEVWNDALNGKEISTARSEYFLPEQFNQEGNHFIENAISKMAKFFDDILNEAWIALPDEVFWNNISTTVR